VSPLASSADLADRGRMQAVARMPSGRRVLRASAYLAASAVLLTVLVFLLLLAILFADGAVSAYWIHPQVHDGVSELALREKPVTFLTGPQDFAGDGIADKFETKWAERDPPFGRSTLEMVYVHSGRTGRTLLAHPTGFAWDEARWCGDADGNETSDVYVPGDRVVLGYTRRR
jgi:hypothetical protein